MGKSMRYWVVPYLPLAFLVIAAGCGGGCARSEPTLADTIAESIKQDSDWVINADTLTNNRLGISLKREYSGNTHRWCVASPEVYVKHLHKKVNAALAYRVECQIRSRVKSPIKVPVEEQLAEDRIVKAVLTKLKERQNESGKKH